MFFLVIPGTDMSLQEGWVFQAGVVHKELSSICVFISDPPSFSLNYNIFYNTIYI